MSFLLVPVLLTLSAATSPSPGELRCEYLVDPMNVGTRTPRLSWIDRSPARSWKQTAYEILVASKPELLNKGQGDLWDSGKVNSADSIQISYAGKALHSRERCYWKVKVWGSNGDESGWSGANFFELGLLGSNSWQGTEWIGRAASAGANPAPHLRKEFSVSGKVQRARIYACGLGYADIRLDGQPVSPSERDPGYTNFDKRVLYVTYDVTRLIKQGKNALGAILGSGWYDVHDKATWRFEQAPWRSRPKLRLKLVIDFADGKKETVRSDASWKVASGPIVWDGIYTGEMYDARLEMPGWDQPGFDDRAWSPVSILEAPKGVLAPRICPPVEPGELIPAKSITEPVPGTYIVDLGQNFAGHARLRVNCPAGQKIQMRYSERLDAKGMIQRSEIETFMAKQSPPQPFQSDIYICKGQSTETFEQRFSYSGFRYVEVTGLPYKPDKGMVTGVFSHTTLDRAGSFSASNDLLNKIQRATLYSYLSNAQSIFTDCPQREKNGWTGDAQLACEAGLMNFHSQSLYTKWLDDLADDQDKNGQVSLIIPSDGWGHGAYHPAWDSAYAIVANDLYDYCGDLQIFEKHYDHIRRYLDSLYGQAKEDVVPFDSLGDWEPWSTETPSQATSTVFLYVDAKIVAKAAALLGKTEDAAKYAEMAERVKTGFNAKFYDAAKHDYSNNSQTANAMALYFGLVTSDRKTDVLASLVSNIETQGHIDSGILGGKFILRVLSENGRTDLAYKLVARKEQPGWGWWIGQGATTLWEDWKGESSLNHIMFGDVSNWFFQWIAGIGLDPSSPGFAHFRIQPQPVGDLSSAKASYDSPHGKIVSSWRKASDGFHLDITVPANTSATVWLPATGESFESGHPLVQAVGVSHVRSEHTATVFEVQSGSYSFLVRGY